MANPLTETSKAIALAASYVRATWIDVVMGNSMVPGSKPITQSLAIRKRYADSIVIGDMLAAPNAGMIRAKVLTIEQLAVDLENGKGPWDMKPSLLNGPKARMSAKGKKYNIIPFRHGTSAKNSPNNNFPTMPPDILAGARALEASLEMAPKKIKWGGRLTGTEMVHPPQANRTTGEAHKSGRFEGMARMEKTYESATQSKYLTFRVVSENSAPGSWIHPGYKAHGIAKGVDNFCRPAVERMIRAAVEKDLGTAAGVAITTKTTKRR